MNGIMTGTATLSKQARPSIHRISIAGIRAEHVYIEKYWWIKIEHLMDELCATRINRACLPSLSAPSELFDRYGFLCDHDEGRALLTWAAPTSYAVDCELRPKDIERYGIFLPLGFSSAILDLATQGIVNVTCLKSNTGVLRPEKIPLPVYTLVGHDMQKKEHILLREGRYGPYHMLAA